MEDYLSCAGRYAATNCRTHAYSGQRRTPYPAGSELPSQYYRTLDPFVTLAAAPAVTLRIEHVHREWHC